MSPLQRCSILNFYFSVSEEDLVQLSCTDDAFLVLKVINYNINFNEQNETFAEKKNEIQRTKLIKLITAGPERTMFGEGILGMKFIYNDDFLLHLFIKGRIIYPPNLRS